MKQFFAQRPWIFFILAFVVLIAAWTVFIIIAVKNQPEAVPLATQAQEQTQNETKAENHEHAP